MEIKQTTLIEKEVSIPLILAIANTTDKEVGFNLFKKEKPEGLIVISESPANRIMDYEELMNGANKKRYKIALITFNSKHPNQTLARMLYLKAGEDLSVFLGGKVDESGRTLIPIRRNILDENDKDSACDCDDRELGDGEDFVYCVHPHTEVVVKLYPSESSDK